MFYPPAPLLRSLYQQLLGLPLATGLLLALCVESRAESITAESIWNKENAIERAQRQLPPQCNDVWLQMYCCARAQLALHLHRRVHPLCP
jgi:hypothetical protein